MNTVSAPRAKVLRAMANALSAAIFVVALLLVFGEGVPRLTALPPSTVAQFTSFAIMLTGLVVGLFLPPVGAVMTLAGFAAFWGVNVVATGVTSLGGAFALFPIAAGLQLASWWHARRAQTPRS